MRAHLASQWRLRANTESSRNFRLLSSMSVLAVLLLLSASTAAAAVLWSDLGATLVHETGPGVDILGGALRRDDSSSGTLYFKFHVNPSSDLSTEEYFAAFQLFEGDKERLALGNSPQAWAYSAFNTAQRSDTNSILGDVDFQSVRPELLDPNVTVRYERVRRGIESTIVFKVEYIPGADDLITVWLNPDLASGATEAGQPERLTTKFKANASFDQIRLRHGGGGGGWTFNDMAIATDFRDFVGAGSAEVTGSLSGRGAMPFTIRTWQSEQGLPQNAVHALLQTREGYIWLGGDDGVTRFDGVRFVFFGLREGMPRGRVRVLYEDSQNALWIGSAAGGLSCYARGALRNFTAKDGLPADAITSLCEDAEGKLWVGTEAGLAVWRSNRFESLAGASELNGKNIPFVVPTRRGSLWLGATGVGVFQLSNGKLSRVSDASIETLLQDPHCLLEDRAGRVWVGAGDDYLLCQDGGEWRRYRISRHLARPYISSLTEEPGGAIWAGSVSEGLFEFKNGILSPLNATAGLADNFVESLLVDREANLWVGTSAGLSRLRRKSLVVYSQNEGLGYGAVQGLAEVSPGVIWAGKPNDGLFRWSGESFTRLAAGDFIQQHPQINSLLVTRDGSCWVGTGGGLERFQNPKAESPQAESPQLAGLDVRALAEDPEGGLWAGTRTGEMWHWRSGAWSCLTNYGQTQPISALVQEKGGGLWVGTDGGGLSYYRAAERNHLDKSSGLLSDSILTLFFDAERTLWIGTAGGGLSGWRAGHLTTYTTREGLPANTISQISMDDAGCLWLGSNRGIACVNKRELDELAAGKTRLLYPQTFGRAEGMSQEECTGGFHPAGLKTSSGKLWFSTLEGIVVVDPKHQSFANPAPLVALEEILLDGSELPPLRSMRPGISSRVQNEIELRIPPGDHRLEFQYTGLSFSAPDRVRFRYRLEPLDNEWLEAGSRRTAYYGYVPPGAYHFRVTACNEAGIWNANGATIALTVLPHFWRTWWFVSLLACGVVLSVGGSVRIVEKRKLHARLMQLEQERALERERARIAQDLHDDLGSSLTRISLLSDLVKADKHEPAQVETHAQKISQSAGQTVRALEEIVWALRPGSDTLQSLVDYIAHFANELFESDTARCRLDLPHDLPAHSFPPEVRHNIFLLVKEALTNALKHARAHEVRVQAKVQGNRLEILVQDDGHGFTVTAEQKQGKGQGLGNMRRRVESIGGTFSLQSTPGKGTVIGFTIPLGKA